MFGYKPTIHAQVLFWLETAHIEDVEALPGTTQPPLRRSSSPSCKESSTLESVSGSSPVPFLASRLAKTPLARRKLFQRARERHLPTHFREQMANFARHLFCHRASGFLANRFENSLSLVLIKHRYSEHEVVETIKSGLNHALPRVPASI